MAFKDSMTRGVPSDENINKKYNSLLNTQLDSMDSTGSDFKDIPQNNPHKCGAGCNKGVMHSNLMTWTTLLEAMDEVMDNMDTPTENSDPMNQPIQGTGVDEKLILDQLNKIFTPVLVMQGFEKDIADKTNATLAEASVLTERNIISFDDETRMSQLINVCAKLIAQQKNTEQWQMFKKAAAIKKQASINIQKEEYDTAKTLAQKYLVMVSTTNNSSVARDAANDLLPQTQH